MHSLSVDVQLVHRKEETKDRSLDHDVKNDDEHPTCGSIGNHRMGLLECRSFHHVKM